jgi:hypothetical protein
MLTIDELAAIAIFATLPQAEIARIARTSADIRLAPGEFVVHEGDPGVLIVVVSGRLELSKLMRGAEPVIGTRRPGSIFGEVPMVFGMLMQAEDRAVEATRVLRLEGCGRAEGRPLAGRRPRPLPLGDQHARHLRLRRRALQPGQTRGLRRGRGQQGHRVRPSVPKSEAGPSSWLDRVKAARLPRAMRGRVPGQGSKSSKAV